MQTKLAIRGMTCAHCVKAVESVLKGVEGVTDVKVTVGEAVVTTDGPPNQDVLREAIRSEGYEPA